jgi:hypothetical protein
MKGEIEAGHDDRAMARDFAKAHWTPYLLKALPVGANFLYLAIAEERMGDLLAARETAREAQRAGELTPYEKRLLDELKVRLKR